MRSLSGEYRSFTRVAMQYHLYSSGPAFGKEFVRRFVYKYSVLFGRWSRWLTCIGLRSERKNGARGVVTSSINSPRFIRPAP
jgi:hypothetical protein